MSGVCASRTLPPPNNLPLDVNITASEKQNKSCLYFQAILPSFNTTLVDHKSILEYNRCTSRGGGTCSFFGGQGFQEKLPGGGSP
jgi:hypothetical protein